MARKFTLVKLRENDIEEQVEEIAVGEDLTAEEQVALAERLYELQLEAELREKAVGAASALARQANLRLTTLRLQARDSLNPLMGKVKQTEYKSESYGKLNYMATGHVLPIDPPRSLVASGETIRQLGNFLKLEEWSDFLAGATKRLRNEKSRVDSAADEQMVSMQDELRKLATDNLQKGKKFALLPLDEAGMPGEVAKVSLRARQPKLEVEDEVTVRNHFISPLAATEGVEIDVDGVKETLIEFIPATHVLHRTTLAKYLKRGGSCPGAHLIPQDDSMSAKKD